MNPASQPALFDHPSAASSALRTVLGCGLAGGGIAAATALLELPGVSTVILLEPTWAEVDRSREIVAFRGLSDRISVRHYAARLWLRPARAA